MLVTSEHTEVVIVGAGPTGLTAAVLLAHLGIPYVLLDASTAPTTTSNAALVHASTLELLAELGVGDTLVAAGRRIHRIAMVDRGRLLLRVPFSNLPSRYPYALGVPQSTTEELLLRRLAELSGSVRRRHHVETVQTRDHDVIVTGTVESPGAAVPFTIRARYVIGADGSHSTVRAALGLGFPGQTYPSQFVLADVALTDAAHAGDEATINMSAHGVTVIAQLPSGNHRIVATVDAGVDAPARPDRAFVDDLLRDRGIRARCAADPAWSSAFRVHHRVAARFRVGPVFLAGDAAHIHSPAAGQGMNTGIADAFDLATRMAAVLNGQADESTLDTYDRLRRAVALEVLHFTDRLTRVAMLRNPAARFARRVGTGTLGRLRPVQHRLAMWVTGLQRSPLHASLPAVTPRQLEGKTSK
jgi:2-polyprenyl-6-methoxyphenol hydroxylase-like FAD-dependent oxidoreductase